MKEKNIGSSFDSWLREEGIYEDAASAAIERASARQAADAGRGEEAAPNGGGGTGSGLPRE